MTNYRVIQSQHLIDLQEQVQVLLNSGWKCQGGVAAAFWVKRDTMQNVYLQAMIADGEGTRRPKQNETIGDILREGD